MSSGSASGSSAFSDRLSIVTCWASSHTGKVRDVPLLSQLVYRRSVKFSRLSVYCARISSTVPLAIPLPVVSHVLKVASLPVSM